MSQSTIIASIKAQLATATAALNTAAGLVASLAPVQTPTINSLSPNNGPIGTAITVAGSNFGSTQGSSTIKFNGVTATPTSWSNTSIVVPVPATATTGTVVIRVSGIDSNAVTFTVTVAPAITSLSPTTGAVATSVTITGTNFGATQGSSTVKFNGVTATPSSWSATSIVAPVPAGAVTGNVVVTVGNLASNGSAFTVTFGATVNNNRDIHSIPTPPTLGAAGTYIIDPTFGTKIWRASDINTIGGGSIHMPSSIEGAWNSDGTKFVCSDSGGGARFFSFDPTTGPVFLPGITIQNQAEPWFSYTDPNAIYSNSYNPSTGSYRLIKKWDIAHGTNTVAADLDALYSGQGMTPGGYVGPVVVRDNDVLVVLFGGYGQDSHFLVHHSVLGLIDSRTLVVQSNAGPVTGFTMHGIGVDRTGKLFLNPSGADISAHPGIAQIQVYNSITHTLTPLTVSGGGHYQLGYNKMVNQDASGTFDSAQWVIRSLDNVGSVTNLISPLLTPQLTTMDDHSSWRSASPTVAKPFLSLTIRTEVPAFGAVAIRAWDNEIITIATDGSGEVRRHGHHQSVYDPNDFYSQSQGHMDPTGRYCAFATNWGNNLGTGRTDVFIAELSL